MTWFIHLEKRFEKEIESLRKTGEKASVAARKAEEIVANLAQNGSIDLKHAGKLTGWGEHRVYGCIKYDLGDGFRMICFKRGTDFYVSYVGTHDDCHNYLDHYCGRHNWVGKRNGSTIRVDKNDLAESQTTLTQTTAGLEEDYDDLLPAQIDERMLRKVFSGLWKNEKQPE